MKHLEFLEQVTIQDCATIREKEATYQGSWKRRGGVGAFMMLARKWDRIENMMTTQSERQFDVFHGIEQDTSGRDGSPLAEIRDLRCYLILIEAEMLSRGALDKKPSHTHERRVPRMEMPPSCKDDAVHPSGHDGRDIQRTPEDGAQHASLAPHVVRNDYFARKDISAELRTKFWNLRAPGVHVLDVRVENHELPRVLRDFYQLDTDGAWMLRIDRVPADARQFYQVLHRERNAFELDQMPEWQRKLYSWDEAANKHVLCDAKWAATE